MKFFLQTLLCFVFAALVVGQGYGRRRHRPVAQGVNRSPIVQKPPYRSNFETFNPMFGQINNGMDSLRGGGMSAMPDEIKQIIGSTLNGNAIVGGMDGFPRHGGVLNDNGLVNGWGARPNVPAIPEVDMWSDPLNGALFPENYNGEELVYDPVTNKYIVKNGGTIGNQIRKESHGIAKSDGMMPSSHNTLKAEHTIQQEASHIARKTIAGVPAGRSSMNHGILTSTGTVNAGHVGFDDPSVIRHNIGKATLGSDAVRGHNIAKSSGTPVGVGFINPGGHVATQVNHGIAKATAGVDPFGAGFDEFGQMTSNWNGGDSIIDHGMAKSGRHVGVSKIGTVNAGHIGVDAPGVIQHNIRTATLGADAVVGHNIAKSFGTPVGVGFINPTGLVASQMGHDIAKASSGVIVDPFNSVGHNIAKTTGEIGFGPVDPVHNVNKIGHSGFASQGHDPLAATLGHGIAKQAVSEAAQAVNFGTRGGVQAGDPIALSATQGLAKESIHVAGKTMDMAASGVAGSRHVAAGMNIFGEGSMMGHSQVEPVRKPFPKITGYGRRQRRPRW